jgi:predicted acetyltransferase
LQKFADTFWGEHFHPQAETARDFFGTPTFAVVARKQGQLIGLTFCTIRDLVFNNEAVSYGGVGGVVTHTDYRHQGVATAVVAEVVNILKARGVDIAILCAGIERQGNLYTNVGFKILGRPYYFTNKNGEVVAETGGMIMACAGPEKVERILAGKEKLYIGISNF